MSEARLVVAPIDNRETFKDKAKGERPSLSDLKGRGVLVQPARDLRMRAEFRGDIRAGLAGAHDACIGAGAKRECQGVDQDRFAGACFA